MASKLALSGFLIADITHHGTPPPHSLVTGSFVGRKVDTEKPLLTEPAVPTEAAAFAVGSMRCRTLGYSSVQCVCQSGSAGGLGLLKWQRCDLRLASA